LGQAKKVSLADVLGQAKKVSPTDVLGQAKKVSLMDVLGLSQKIQILGVFKDCPQKHPIALKYFEDLLAFLKV